MTAVAIIGPGAIGATVAVRLMESPRCEVCICARTPIGKLCVETPEGLLTVTSQIFTSPEEAKIVDWVLVATKAYDSDGTAKWLRALIGPTTRVAILQNGVEQVARFAPFVPVAQLVPVIVSMPVERIADGTFRQRRAGQLTVAAGENGERFADLFAGTSIAVATTQDFRTEAWRKLALNCAGAVSALVLKPAVIVRNNDIADIMRALVRECIAVGQKEGADLDEALVEQVIENYRGAPAEAINSMHADRIAGRPLEIDARNGAVVRIGRKHDISTPINKMIVALLQIVSP